MHVESPQDSCGAPATHGPGRSLRLARAALVCCGLVAQTTPAAAQWFDRPETVRADDTEGTSDAAPAPPAPAPPPNAPPATAPPPTSPAPPPAAPPPTAELNRAPEAGVGPVLDERHGEAARTSGAQPVGEAEQRVPVGPAGSEASKAAAPEPASTAPTAGQTAEPAALRFRLAVSVEAAFGGENRFRNYLFGPRLDLRFTERTAIGYAVRYANLEGPDDRAHNALHTVTVDHRVFHPSGAGFTLPVRLSGGYLPNNGPFLQPAAGVGLVTERLEFVLLPLAPTFWNTGNQTWISYDVALEVGVHL